MENFETLRIQGLLNENTTKTTFLNRYLTSNLFVCQLHLLCHGNNS